jgi:hypothetical protein
MPKTIYEMEAIKSKRGGARPNAGRKKKYGEETRVLTIRVPQSTYNDMKKAVRFMSKRPQILENLLEAMDALS